MLDIITITKDDFSGFCRTVASTKILREKYGVKQIVVDGSAPSIKQKNIEYIKKEKNLDYFWQKPDGIANAFNFGLSKAKAEWILFLNGGDNVYEGIDYRLFISFLKRTSADILIFEMEENGKEIKHPPLHLVWPPFFNWVSHPATLVRKNLFKKFGNFKSNYHIAMDGDLWLRLFSQHNVIVDLISIPIVVVYPGGVHSNTHVVAQETLRSIWENREVLIKRSLNRLILFLRALLFYIGKSLNSQ